MKKIFISILAIAAITACSKTEVSYDVQSEIYILPVNENVTKSVMSGNDFLGDHFMLWAWYNETAAGSDMIATWKAGFASDPVATTIYIDEKTFVEKNDAQNKWGGETPYYWPKTGSLIFAGYHAPRLTGPDDVQYRFSENQNCMIFNDVGGVYLMAVVILVLLRKKLFRRMFANLFSGIIKEESPADSWKPLLLMIVRNLRGSLDA